MFKLNDEKRYDFRTRMLLRNDAATFDDTQIPESDEYVISGGLRVKNSLNSLPVDNAVADFKNFLSASAEWPDKAKDDEQLILAISSDLGDYSTYKGYRVAVRDTGIEICGFDERGVAQALYDLEDIINFRRAPFLKKGVFYRKPIYTPMLVHSGYGICEYPDAYLKQLARDGRDAIMIYVRGVNETLFGHLDFNDVIRRAGSYGIDVYAYIDFGGSGIGPYDDSAEKYYESRYGSLFDACPGFKGIILVGESIEFSSIDPHVSGSSWRDNFVDGIPTGQVSPGWYPCVDYPDWLALLQKIISRRKPDADIIFWSYNFCNAPEEARVKLIERLPEGISLLTTFEMGEIIQKEHVSIVCADYTLSVVGPGRCFESEAAAAARRNIKLYAMTNTGGTTWDFGVVPYEPMPQQWQKRYSAMRRMRDSYHLSGIMECHHYGLYPSFISKLSKWSFTEPEIAGDALLRQVLIMEYGEKDVDKISEALSCLSEAITYFTPTDADQYGAFRVGPAYPFCLDTEIAMRHPEKATLKGNGVVYTNYINFEKGDGSTIVGLRISAEIKSLQEMQRLLSKGINILSSAENETKAFALLYNQCKYMLCVITTGIHAKEWYCLKCTARAEHKKEALVTLIEKMDNLLLSEKANAEQAIEYVRKDSRLGWEPSMEYIGDAWHIEWKLRHLDYVRNIELMRWRDASS